MVVFDIHPRRRAGKLTFGLDRATARSILETMGFTPSRSRNGMDYYDDSSIQLDFFDDEMLHYIGFAYSPNFEVTYNSLDPFNSDAVELFKAINDGESTPVPFNDYDLLFPTQIISLWDAQEQYDNKGGHCRSVYSTFSMGDERYLDEIMAINIGG